MFGFTIIINLVITLCNLYLVVKIWQLKKRLYLITQQLNNCESLIHSLLILTPSLLLETQNNLAHFRQRYQLLQIQIRQIQQIIILLNWVYQIGRRVARFPAHNLSKL